MCECSHINMLDVTVLGGTDYDHYDHMADWLLVFEAWFANRASNV